ncbi:hypothetical protein ACFY2R_18170 [Micromonospora olivasterospora]|uniref:hypothetical protein n=1 Tax=Micromonospora olivasterospora TaxID=1880 RepID=UPI0011A378D1|nr:hypothetical protein [Micromonospora olivasterospora]
MVIDVFLPLLLVIALIWVVKNAAEDVMHASKGQNSPRREFWDKRWSAREKRTGKPRPKATGFWSKGPLRCYLFDSWADAWANANTKRADRVDDERAAYEAARAEQVAARDAALAAAAEQRTQQSRPTPGPAPAAGQADAQPAPAGTATAVTDPASIPTPTPEELAAMFARPSMPNPVSPTGQAAPSSKEAAPMSTPTPEVSGHASAKNYADAMAKAAVAAVTSLEQTIARMTAGKVGGPALGHLAQAQESATAMAAQLRAAHAVLAKHDAVGEAYQANRDAGDKDWMTKE